MKKIYLFLSLCLGISTQLLAQHNISELPTSINENGTAPDSSAILDLQADDKGLLIPRMNIAARDLIGTPALGLLIFQTDDAPGFYYFDGTGWASVGADGALNDELNISAVLNGTNLELVDAGGTLVVDLSALQDGVDDADADPTNEIELPTGGTNGQLLQTDGVGNVSWATPTTTTIISDSDNDTKIQVEESTDEDVIRFDLGGTEYMKLTGGRLELDNTLSSVYIGKNAGQNNSGGNSIQNVAIGYNAMKAASADSYGNTVLGYHGMQNNTTGDLNIVLGRWAFKNATSGDRNIIIGGDALLNASSANNNVIIGFQAGPTSTNSISHSVYIGNQAGQNETNSNRLYIDNSNTTTPLIYGEFNNDLLRINGTLDINDAFSFPTTDGTDGQLLQTDGAGNVSWSTPATTTIISDTDNDTKIQVEENTDEDKIRFDIAGNEQFRMENSKFTMKNAGLSANDLDVEFNSNLNIVGVGVLKNEIKNILPFNASYNPNDNKMRFSVADNETLELSGDGSVQFNNAYTFPTADGTTGQVLQTDGAGDLSWATPTQLSEAEVDAFVSNNDYLTTGGNEGVFVDTNGEVGINETSPDDMLHVTSGGNGTRVRAENSSNGWAGFVSKNTIGEMFVGVQGAFDANPGEFHFYDNVAGSRRMVIDANGNVGIGRNNPSVKLDVNGSVNCTGGSCSSDFRWKKDIQPLNNALDKINQLRGVSYFWRTAEFPERNFAQNRQIGLIAQEVETVYPDLIHTNEEGFKSMDYQSFTAVLLEGIKELNEENQALKQKIEALEAQAAKINQLEAAIQALSAQANTDKEAEE